MPRSPFAPRRRRLRRARRFSRASTSTGAAARRSSTSRSRFARRRLRSRPRRSGASCCSRLSEINTLDIPEKEKMRMFQSTREALKEELREKEEEHARGAREEELRSATRLVERANELAARASSCRRKGPRSWRQRAMTRTTTSPSPSASISAAFRAGRRGRPRAHGRRRAGDAGALRRVEGGEPRRAARQHEGDAQAARRPAARRAPTTRRRCARRSTPSCPVCR